MIGKLFTWSFVHVPWLARAWARRRGVSRGAPPFVPLTRPLAEMTIALVTTGGVHHLDDRPFKRKSENPAGDGSWRSLDFTRPPEDFRITHDWYDATDARQDLELVLPVKRLRELVTEGVIGALHPTGFGLMGHIEGAEERRLEAASAPEIAGLLQGQAVDAVLLVPA